MAVNTIKSSQTYHPEFEKGFKALERTFPGRVAGKAVIYAGALENNAGAVKLINYHNMTF